MQPSAAAIAYARQRLGRPVMAPLLEAVPTGGPFPQIRVVGLGCGTAVLGAECGGPRSRARPSGRATCVS